MDHTSKQKAVIYCRVSSVKQLKDGDGLASQETRCREYAKHKNYTVIGVFKDEGVSGSLINRPRMQLMLAFLKEYKNKENLIVIIDDISRLARGLDAHLQLRIAISDAGGKLESPTLEFGEDSDSQLVENLLASVSQHQRQKNAEQSKNRMRARAMNGYWVFQAPLGYRYSKVAGHGKLLIKNEPLASIIQEAIEGFASRRFETQSEVKCFLESRPDYPKDKNGEIHYQRITEIFSRPVYAGYIDLPDWGIHMQPAKHEPLVSFEVWNNLQIRLTSGQSTAPLRKDIHEDFPLRGFIVCACCNQPMTACWSKGRSRAYPYYLCRTRDCPEDGKSIRKETLERAFEDLLAQLQPNQDLFLVFGKMLKNAWELRMTNTKQDADTYVIQLRQIEKKSLQIMDRILETDNHMLVKAYENQACLLEKEKILLKERMQNCGRPLASFDETFRTAMDFLANPCNLWASERIEDKRTVLKLVFASKLPYDRKEGFRTAPIAQPFLLFQGFQGHESEMVRVVGVEPTRPCGHQILSLARLPVSPHPHYLCALCVGSY